MYILYRLVSLCMTERKTTIKSIEMPEEMKIFAIETSIKAVGGQVKEGDVAHRIKREFDKKFYPCWQCIVGRNFAADVIHEKNCFIYFYIGQIGILLWKTN